jgi:hypothetical protein
MQLPEKRNWLTEYLFSTEVVLTDLSTLEHGAI